MVIAVINNKGGTGKTTTSVNLAAGMAAQGERTLLVDLDSQASASLSLGLARDELRPSTSEALLEGLPLEEIVRPGVADGLDLAPAHLDLANADIQLADVAGREKRLAIQLERVRHAYDWVVLDCSPSLSLLSINALMASDTYLIPVKAEHMSLEGLNSLTETLERLRAGMSCSPSMTGILLTMVHPSSRATWRNCQKVRREHGNAVLETYIPQDVRLFEAPGHGRSIFDHAPRSKGALAYRRMLREVRERMPRKERSESHT
jgi:chromosome partitioning protein